MIGAALGSSCHVANRLITTAIELTERLPRTCALLVSGWIGLAAAHMIADETALVADEHIDDLDALIAWSGSGRGATVLSPKSIVSGTSGD